MADDDFSCVNFSPQKWRKDMCRNCYQPLKVHSNVKEDQGQSSPPKQPSPSVSPWPVTRSPSGGKSQPKVFQRIQVEKKPIIDKTIPARERTVAPKTLEGIQPGTVKKIHEIAPTLKTRDPPSIPPPPTGATPTPQAPTPPTPPQMSPKPVLKSKPSPPIPRRPVGKDIPARPKPPPQPKKDKPKTSPSISPVRVSKQTSQQELSAVDKKVEVNLPQEEVKEVVQESPKQELPSEDIVSTTKVETSEIEEETKSSEKDTPLVEPTPSTEPAMPEQSIELSPENAEEISAPVHPVIEDEVPTPDETEPVDSSPLVADSETKSQELIDTTEQSIEISPESAEEISPPAHPVIEDEVATPATPDETEPVDSSPPIADSETKETSQELFDTTEQSIELSPESAEEISPPAHPVVEDEEATPDETEPVDSSPQIADTETKESSQELIDEVNSLEEPVSEPALEEQVADQDVDIPQQNQPTSVSEAATQEEPQTDTPIVDDFVIVDKGDVPEHDDIVLPEVAEAVVCIPTLVESSVPDQPEGDNDGTPTENEADNIPTEDGVDVDNPLTEEAEGSTENASNNTETTEEVKTEDTEEGKAESPNCLDGAALSRSKIPEPEPQEDDDVRSKEPAAVAAVDVVSPPPPLGAPPPPPPPPIGVPPPPPPPPPPPSQPVGPAAPSAHNQTMQAILSGGVTLKSVSPPKERRGVGGNDMQSMVMQAIRGGVSLKSVPPPQQRSAGEEKVVDIASELRMKVLKRRKQEAQSVKSGVDEHREEVIKMGNLLQQVSGTHSFIHQLRSLLHQVDTLLSKVKIPPEMLTQHMQWPDSLVDYLREVLDHMKELELKVVACENLCKQTMGGAGGNPSGSPAPSWRVNPEAIERCVQDVVRLARNLSTDESRYFRASTSFPIDATDIQGLLMRAGDAVSPLVDKLYEKAFNAYASVFNPTATKFDQSFRLQNAQRLLRMCCQISDKLALHLQVGRHSLYSDAQLKCQELSNDFVGTLKVADKQGEWDTEEQLVLGRKVPPKPADKPESSEVVKRMIASLSGDGSLPPDTLEQLTPELLTRMEPSLITAAIATRKTQVIDGCVKLRNNVFAGDEAALHKNDFLWLLQTITKGNHECLTHLVQSCAVPVNCRSTENGTTVLHRAAQRQDLATVACLIRLGADPLLKNTFNSSTTDMLALKHFPPKNFIPKLEEKEPLFDLASYINSPSLSDVELISEDGSRFHAHRLVLCAQSPVFKSMLDSELWVESRNKEIPLPTLTGKVVQVLLQYLYTGRCLFPRDDLNLGIELMAAADQFLLDPMKAQCERLLSDKIDQEVAVPLYYAAFRFSTPILLANTCNYVLSHYGNMEDPEHEALLHILDNTPQK